MDNEQVIENTIISEDGIVATVDPLALDIPDKELTDIIDKRIEESRKFFASKYNLYERRKKNEKYLFGRQLREKEEKKMLKIYEARFLDNALYEIEASIKPLAMNKLPDLIVAPGNSTPEAKETAKQISEIVNSDIKKRNNRVVLGIAFKHRSPYFTGIIKCRWNPELGKYGDYVYEVVHPDNIDIDHTCPTNNADDMSFISQTLPITVQECVMRFPNAKDELFAALKKEGLVVGEGDFTWKDLASEIKIKEVWIKWYKKAQGTDVVTNKSDIPHEPGVKWEQVRGVVWKYKKVVLQKIKNPNFDYEGEEQTFVYDNPAMIDTKRPMNDGELMMAMATGMTPTNVTTEQVYKNYFQMPRSPYYFMGYDQWHKIAYDETTSLEQNIGNQESLDKRGKQIQETLDQRGKHVFSKEGGLDADNIEEMDMNDPDQDLLIDGDVTKTHKFLPPERPEQQEFADMASTRDRMYGIAGANAIRGQLQSDTATTNQIAREADYTRADDLVEDTINAACEWMASWAMQMIKLRYTEEHMRKVLGRNGSIAHIRLKNDMIDDGQEVMIKASGTDKLKAQNNAMDMAKLQLADPLSFYEDMGLSDPEGRTEKLLTYMGGAADGYAMYLAKYILHKPNIQSMVGAIKPPMPAAPAAPQPTPPAAPQQNPSPTNTANVPAAPPAGPPAGSPRLL